MDYEDFVETEVNAETSIELGPPTERYFAPFGPEVGYHYTMGIDYRGVITMYGVDSDGNLNRRFSWDSGNPNNYRSFLEKLLPIALEYPFDGQSIVDCIILVQNEFARTAVRLENGERRTTE